MIPKPLNKITVRTGTSRLTAFLVLSAILWLGTPAASMGDVWTGRVVNGWTFQSPPVSVPGWSLTGSTVQAQAAFDNVRNETDGVTDFGALAMHLSLIHI